MTITSTEVADILGMTTNDSRYPLVTALLPSVCMQVNTYCNNGFARQVKEEPSTFSAAGTSGGKTLEHQLVIRHSVFVTSTDLMFQYWGDDDYTAIPYPRINIPSTYVREYSMDYENGVLYLPSTTNGIDRGRLTTANRCLCTYSYVDIFEGGKPAVAKIIQQAIDQPGGIASESIGILSRSYYQNGYDGMIRTMLAPYRRVKFV
jgi:hypothetical protein